MYKQIKQLNTADTRATLTKQKGQQSEFIVPQKHNPTQPGEGNDLAVSMAQFYVDIDMVNEVGQLCTIAMHYAPLLGFDKLAYHHFAKLGTIEPDEFVLKVFGFDTDEFALAIRAVNNARVENALSTLRFLERAGPVDQWMADIGKLGINTEVAQAFVKRNLTYGYVFPVFWSCNRNGYFILNFEEKISPERFGFLQSFCQTLHNTYCSLYYADQSEPFSLSRRERQILFWVARGKSNSVIADIVGISPHTVNGYLRQIYLKTGSTDRTTAALRALSSGMIA